MVLRNGWFRSGIFVTVLGFAIWLSGGCALHPPMSQLVVLEKHGASSESKTRMGISASTALNVEDIQKKEAQDLFADDANGEKILLSNPEIRGLGVHFTRLMNEDQALSFTVGARYLGVDFTRHISSGLYFTGIFGAPDSFEGMVLRPIWETPHGLLLLGVYSRYENFYVEWENPGAHPNFEGPDGHFDAFSFGLKVNTFLLSTQSPMKPRFVLHFSTYAGYYPRFEEVLVGVQVSLSGH